MPNLIDIQDGQQGQIQAATTLSYNGLLLTDVITEDFSFNEVTTPDGTQVLYNHIVLNVTAIINPEYNNFQMLADGATLVRTNLGGQLSDENANIIYQRMMEPRKLLVFTMPTGEGVTSPPLVPNTAERFTTDANQGPHPIAVQITRITGTGSYFVRFGIETWIDDCLGGGRAIRAHRFSMSHDVDGDTWLTTKVVTGQVYFSPEWLEKRGQIPDQIVFPKWMHPMEPGFKRSHVKVQALPNGMEVAYSFVDTEQALPLGSLSPALAFKAEFSISSSFANGEPANTQAMCHVAASGPKNQYRMNLLIMAIKVALRKLQKPGLIKVHEIVVSYSLDNTFVDLSLKAIWNMIDVGPNGLHLPLTGLLATDDVGDIDVALADYRAPGEAKQGSERQNALMPKMGMGERRGTYTGSIVGSAIVNGCYAQANKIKEVAFSGGNVGDLIEPNLTAPASPPKTDTGDNASYSLRLVPVLSIVMQATGISSAMVAMQCYFEDWRMDTSYRTNHQIAMMPVGYKQGSSPGDARQYVPPQFATMGLPYTLKVVSGSVACVCSDPSKIVLPSPDTGDSNDVLLAEDISPAVPSINDANTKCWRISFTYWYGQKKLRTSSMQAKSQFDDTSDGFATGKSITDPSARAANTIGLSRFVAGYSPSFVG